MLPLRRFIQSLIIFFVRPYTVRELFGWGYVYSIFVGDFRRDWFWADSGHRIMRGKIHGYIRRLDLSRWPHRIEYFLGRWYDLDLQLLMQTAITSGDLVVDIGANRGSFAFVASRLVGSRGKIVCFEPSARSVSILKAEIAENGIGNIEVHPVALGDQEKELSQNPDTLELDGSKSGQTVKVVIGDDLLKSVTPDFIKIDVEGYEPYVIRGLQQTIARCHPLIVTEIAPEYLSRAGSSVTELVSLLRELGYEGYRLQLKRHAGRYTWAALASNFEGSYYNCDALWIHPQSRSVIPGREIPFAGSGPTKFGFMGQQ